MGGGTLGSSLDYDVVVVGAGVVGLAAGAALSASHRTLVVERHDGICQETSSRNSEVVHAGIYYPTDSLKARSCVRGRRLLYERCDRLGIDAPRVGKLIVATCDEEVGGLQQLLGRASNNRVEGLKLVDAAGIQKLEPGTAGVAALWSPESGIVDSHRFAASLQAEAESAGADVVFRTELRAVDRIKGGYELRMGGPDEGVVRSRCVVNAAGLGQPEVSAMVGIDDYPQYPCKGSWFSISPRHKGRLRRLVYPVGRASDGGLGVHICVDVGGGLRLGPDAEWVDGPPFDLSVDPAKGDAFFEAGRRLFDWLERDDLAPDMAGIRAKPVSGPGQFVDFVVCEESGRGLPGWVTVAGIESPGLTSSLALAEEISALIDAV